MHYIQQNAFLPVKDTKIFTLIESKLCGKKKSATEPNRGVSKRTLKQHVHRYLMTEILQKPSLKMESHLFIIP